MKKELNNLASKRWEKVGIKNCAQLPINKKSTPGYINFDELVSLQAEIRLLR
jgi:hypothetical protein